MSSSSRAGSSKGGKRVKVFTREELEAIVDQFVEAARAGGGNFGTVFHGYIKPEWLQHLAVKRSAGDDNIKVLKKEQKCLTALGYHENVIELIGFCEWGDYYALVLEYCEKTLRDTYKDFNWERTITVLLEIAQGLDHVHGCSYAHLDVKPENIMIDEKNKVKLIDFGTASNVAGAYKNVGTPAYAAPEKKDIWQEYDIYSYGVVAMELLMKMDTGKKDVKIEKRKEIDTVADLHVKSIAKFLMSKNPDHFVCEVLVKEGGEEKARKVSELINQCVNENPKSRPKAKDIISTLKSIM